MSVLALFIPLSPITWLGVPVASVGSCAYPYGYHGRGLCKINIVLGYTGAVGCIVFLVSAIRAGRSASTAGSSIVVIYFHDYFSSGVWGVCPPVDFGFLGCFLIGR